MDTTVAEFFGGCPCCELIKSYYIISELKTGIGCLYPRAAIIPSCDVERMRRSFEPAANSSPTVMAVNISRE